MPINTEPLRKILELEREKGYRDSAVFGGLDRFLGNWALKAGESLSEPQSRRSFQRLRLADSNYASLSPEQRREWAAGVLEFLDRADGREDSENKTKAAPRVRRPPSRPGVKSPSATPSLNKPITIIKGISQSLTAKFKKLGVETVRDLLYFFPNRHLDYSQRKPISQLVEGSEETIIANVWQAHLVMLGGRRSTEAIVGDETGNVRAVWFSNPYMVKQLTTNKRVVLSGRVSLFNGRHVFQSPEWEILGDKDLIHTGRLVPVYPLTRGLGQRQVRKLMKEVVDRCAPDITDFLPPGLIERKGLLGLSQALSQAHFPRDETLKDRARLRLAFDELFILQLGVLSKKRHWQQDQPGSPFKIKTSPLKTFLEAMPFELTAAQQRVLKEILSDLEKRQPMTRLLQGEVGSGKTIVAVAALLMAVASGHQGAFMVPTEILAEQHFSSTGQLLALTSSEEVEDSFSRRYSGLLPHPITIALLTGDLKGKKKQGLKRRIKDGEVDIVIGTHALIQKEVSFKRLGLAVIDEQHRFGVSQRSALRQKGVNPHILAMTATPIPRTLALTLYGDLDLSVIDELPPGRLAIKTKWLKPQQREGAYNFLRRQAKEGRQAFIICPLVEESDAIQAKAATAEYERLSREVFPKLKLGLLHGRMSAKEKDAVMRRFRTAELDMLVSTPVIEVGIDVPNATVMLVESADRFGLSQLHQFRGRVGRGTEQSYCMLLAENPSEIGAKRLDIIENIQDGFALAEEDLKLRGPGEFFGTRQSGIPDLKMARLSDVALLELARREAINLFKKDPELKMAGHKLLAKEVARVWPEAAEWS